MADDQDVPAGGRKGFEVPEEGARPLQKARLPGVMRIRLAVGGESLIGKKRQVAALLHGFDDPGVEEYRAFLADGSGAFEGLPGASQGAYEGGGELDA